jgi:hypothetical protein
MKKRIHLACGTEGDYDEREEWVVCAYADKAHAVTHVDLANEDEQRVRDLYRERWDHLGEDEMCPKEPRNKYDRRRPSNRVGAAYNVVSVELRTEAPVR